MTHPQKKAMRLLLRQIMKLGSGLLRELGDTGKGIPKTIGQKFSYHLGKVNLEKAVERFADRKIVKEIKNIGKNAVIAYDLTDIAKPCSKKIEKLGGIFDGSKRKASKGFFVHGVGVGKFLWRLRLHNGNKDFLPQVRKKILDKLIKITKGLNPIFTFDRGNDHIKLFEYLISKSARFIIRLKANRLVILEKTGEILKIEKLKPGRYKVLIQTEKTKQRKTAKHKRYIRYLLVIKKNKKKNTPIRLLCSVDMDLFSDTEIVNFYLKRWGVENSFKQIKTSLNLEQIRVLKFKKFQNLVSLMHLGVLLNEFLFQIVQKNAKKLTKFAITQIYIAYEKFKTF